MYNPCKQRIFRNSLCFFVCLYANSISKKKERNNNYILLTTILEINMKKERKRKLLYVQPSCSVVVTCFEHYLCDVSVTPDGSSSTQESWGSEQTHTGTVIIGDGTGVAPAKRQMSWDENED